MCNPFFIFLKLSTETAETAYRDVTNIWFGFGKIDEKAAKLLAMTFAVFSTPYLFYA
jgi:hypothetical protein